MTTNITIPLALLEQLMEALDKLARLGNEPHFGNSDGNVIAQEALTAGRAALEGGAEPKKFNLTNTATGTLPQRIESIFEAMDKEVAAGRLVRTGPLEWSKT